MKHLLLILTSIFTLAANATSLSTTSAMICNDDSEQIEITRVPPPASRPHNFQHFFLTVKSLQGATLAEYISLLGSEESIERTFVVNGEKISFGAYPTHDSLLLLKMTGPRELALSGDMNTTMTCHLIQGEQKANP